MKRSFYRALMASVFAAGMGSAPLTANANQAPLAADVIVVIDESGSMSGEQRWIGEMVRLLDENLQQYGIGSESQANLYGLVGYGSRSVVPRVLQVDGEKLGSVAGFEAASNRLVTSGGTEDGWRGIEYALNEYPRRNGAAVNIILATDEDRDNTRSSITYQSVRSLLEANRSLLNAVVNARIKCGDGRRALGLDSLGTGYVVDGNGGFTRCDGAYATSGSGRTVDDYVDLALENGGAAWDLAFLRSGGTNAESFTKALLDIKVEEILSQRPTGDLVAVAQATPNPAVAGEQISLDGTGSFHQKDERSIIRWEWDLDDDGTYDAQGPIITTSFPELGDYPVTLRVTDDGSTPLVQTAQVVVKVDTPPLSPTADAGGPYLFCPQTQPWYLDGTGSVNPDDGLSEPGQPGDQLVSWLWDLDNDLSYGDASGDLVDVTSRFAGEGAGDYLIRLQVSDNTSNAFPSSGKPDLTDTAVRQVRIRDESDAACNCLTDIAVRGKMTIAQLTWTDSGAPSYAVHRSTQAGGPYQQIAVTDNRYSTYLDMGLDLDTTYYYTVSELGTDGRPTCRSREVSVTPSARRRNVSNRAPVIQSDPVVSAIEGQAYTYQVEATDPDRRDRKEFSLQVAPAGMVIDAVSGQIEWTPSNVHVGSQTVVVRVADTQGAFDEQAFTISVTNVNQAPAIVSSPELAATELEKYSYQVQAVDPDLGDTLNFELVNGPAGVTIDSSAGLLTWTPEQGQQGTREISLKVIDSEGESDKQSYQLQVRERNYLPSIDSTPVIEAEAASEYRYLVQASDANSDATLTFALGDFPEGMTIDPVTGEIQWVPAADQVGVQPVSVVVSDDRGSSSSQNFEIRVLEENIAPEIITQALPAAREDQSYTATIVAEDPNTTETLQFSFISGPTNMQLDRETGELSWLPLTTQIGNNPVTIRVSDSRGLNAEKDFVIEVLDVNQAPGITSVALESAETGKLFTYQVQASDPDSGDVLEYLLVSGPAGMSMDPESGLLAWTPGSEQEGTYPVRLQVRDADGLSSNQTFDISVSAVDAPPEITSTPVISVLAGAEWQYQVMALDDQDTELVYQLVAGPDGMSMNTANVATWSPSESDEGANAVTVRVSDQSGNAVSQSFTLTVVTSNEPPVISSNPPASARVGQAYRYQVVAEDPESGALTYSLGQAPVGMTIDAGNGSLQWTPAETDEGAQPVAVDVSDPQGATTRQAFTLDVTTDNAPPSITSRPGSGALVGETYSYQLVATDPENEALTYALLSGPSGMTLSANGLVQWTPDGSQTGEYSVSLEVRDPQGASATQSYILNVQAENSAPVFESSPTTTARVGVEYSSTMTATDPEGDALTWKLVSAPAGMAINSGMGEISWVPNENQIGTHQVAVTVTDGRFPVGRTYSVTVAGDMLPPSLGNVPKDTAEVGKPYVYRIVAIDAEGYSVDVELLSAPEGMTLADENGVPTIRWTPVEGDCVKNVRLGLEDRFGQTAEPTWSIQVYAAPKKLNRIQCSAQSEACGG
ncbi:MULTISPECIES: putative Ig domain-containing protein [unclassified Marinobacter]|jgi:hypothetical protein|uniref:putative Ig domain-containing protein n=1 Tax=unclassified Marinobacter TaxID=83889 RepID=UPI00200CB13D|nr:MULTISPECIES: putative Ig domain-containing protein [unclassified Marinobacter]MCL1478996.1 putative Ig domain-containing protein [Marinobacter sp.]MCL1484403.1 putative Ig domain-containing protein [Marinobacter sp.]UQG57958.1 putative Ig domain-containing protein [Marinobacter sp. M4C]UQG66763.1 putative Ig domain-containing protein [Marinobacter sp. M2C]UQG71043.1 putative Ig domain-containing protein [Marinobacter sp. M1C]